MNLVSKTVSVQTVDQNYTALRAIWEATCGKLGYPDPIKEHGMARDYESTKVDSSKGRYSEAALYDKMAEQGERGLLVLNAVRAPQTDVIPWMKLNYIDLASKETQYIELQIGMTPPESGVTAPVQQWRTGQKRIRMFEREKKDSFLHRVDDPYEIMFLDLCPQNEMSPIHLSVKVQETYGFRLESHVKMKETSRTFRNYKMERSIDAPMTDINEDIERLKAVITNLSLTDVKALAASVGISSEVNTTSANSIKKELRAMCSDPAKMHIISARILDGKLQLRELVEQSVNDSILIFKNGQWYIAGDGTTGDSLIRGTSMADLDGSPESARERLIEVMEGNSDSIPRIDITRELKALSKSKELKAWAHERGRSVRDTDEQLKIMDVIEDALSDGLIQRDTESGSWFFFSKSNQVKKIIVSMNNAEGRRPYDILREHVFSKGEKWLKGNLEKCRLGTLQ